MYPIPEVRPTAKLNALATLLPTSNIILYLTSKTANSTVSIKDSNNNEIISCTPTKDYSSVVFSTPKFKLDSTYTIYI